MLMTIYGRAFKVLMKKPLKLWGISLLAILLTGVLCGLCGVAIPVLGLAVALLMSTGLTMLFLKGYRGEEVKTTMLFEAFKDWNTIKRVLCGLGWMSLWIFLWSLIPFVGWIFALIRAYEYRLTVYILVTEPDVPVTEAIHVSSQRTNGYKLQMFLADFVYILMFIAAMIILGLLSGIELIGGVFAFIMVILYIAFIALAPLFAGLVQAAFYEEITGSKKNFCTGCGQPLADGAVFCANCGKPIN